MIKILIMDDSEEKISRIKKVLIEKCLVDSSDIEEAHSVNAGRLKLSSKFYDLLLLDLVLPVADGEEIEPGKSESFIEEMYRFSRLKKPIYVIGLSQYEEKVEANMSHFEDKLWKLIHYDMEKEDWEQLLQNAVESILSTKEQLLEVIEKKNNYDFGIICALSEEFEQLKAAFGLEWTKIQMPNFPIDFFAAEMRTELGHTIKVVAARNCMAGMQAASAMASSVFALFDVKTIFMTGICAGIRKDENDNISYGDIFIAESEYDYGSGKLKGNGAGTVLVPEPKQMVCSYDLISKVNTFIEECHPERKLKSVTDGLGINLLTKAPSIHISPGACGSYVVADSGFAKSLLESNRKLRGLEMEGYGLYLAAHMLKRSALMVKCISDFADSSKGDKYHKLCSFASAWFVIEFIKYTY